MNLIYRGVVLEDCRFEDCIGEEGTVVAILDKLSAKHEDERRRLRVVYVGEECVLSVFQAFAQLEVKPRFVRFPKIAELPEGYEVLEVRHCWERKAFGFLVRHSSFDTVPDGQEIPVHYPQATQVVQLPVRVAEEYYQKSPWDSPVPMQRDSVIKEALDRAADEIRRTQIGCHSSSDTVYPATDAPVTSRWAEQAAALDLPEPSAVVELSDEELVARYSPLFHLDKNCEYRCEHYVVDDSGEMVTDKGKARPATEREVQRLAALRKLG
jgi:hypothetical protein